MRVSVAVSSAHTRNSVKYFLAELLLKSVRSFALILITFEECLVWESPWHVDFYLMPVDCWEFFVDVLTERHVVCAMLSQRSV